MFNLLDIQLAWPPNTQPFIFNRLRALAEHEVRITVVISSIEKIDPSLIPFARIIRLPHREESRSMILVRTFAYTINAFLKQNRRFWQLIKIGAKLNRRFKHFIWWWATCAPLLQVKPDIIHFEWNAAAINYHWLPALWECPFVVSCRGRQVNILPHLPGQENYISQLRNSFYSAGRVHGVSQNILDEAVQYGLDRNKGVVIYTAVDVNYYSPRPQIAHMPKGKFRLINVGVSIWRKGYENLLLAINSVIAKGYDVQLDVADWDGPERERLIYTAKDLGIGDKVHILGKITPEEVREALWASNAFILSSLSEGISNALLEAMSCALPVITTDCGGMREAMTDGVEGYIVPTRDPEAMAQAIIKLIENPENAIKMGQAGRNRVLHQFTLEKQGKAFLNLYTQMLSSNQNS
ncbi:MAG: glycosyltransferase family 4 protein [Anaerolineae bacterium]|nr:glycosyltransferase family 4 protein [Anaerolineae bacterium]